MLVHCWECGHDGEAKINSRGNIRCENCYSQVVKPIEPPAPVSVETTPEPEAVTESGGTTADAHVEAVPEPKPRRIKKQ